MRRALLTRGRGVLACALVLALGGVGSAGASAPTPEERVGVILTVSPAASPQGVGAQVAALGGEVTHTYTHSLRGVAAEVDASRLSQLQTLPGVVALELDQPVAVSGVQVNPPSYGLDRIDQRRGLDRRFTTRATGRGVSAYVVDTGLNYSHVEFTGRIAAGVDVVDGGRADDCNGHGTHVAGTLAGSQFGVAKAARIHPVRVLDCQGLGSTSDVIAGIEWVTRHHQRTTPAVANLSLGGGTSRALDAAVRASIRDNITYVVAGGNDGGLVGALVGFQDACNGSPSRVGEALTVGASDSRDRRARYSNTGACLDLFAPGDRITSAYIGSPRAAAVLSGTSMAAPHVAGVAALTLQVNPRATPAEVQRAIRLSATPGVVADPGPRSPNRLLFTSR